MGAIPASTFTYLIISLILCILGPIAFLLFAGRKMPIRAKIMLTGVIVFIVFALILERFVHSIFLGEGSKIMSVPVYYVIYGCLTAAIFETAAKFIGLKFMIKEPTSPGFALQFGIGYGSMPLIIRERQIKNKMRHLFTPNNMAIIKKSRNTKCW